MYGNFDAFTLFYSSNMTLLNATNYGGSSSDAGSSVILPYVLLSIYANASTDFGVGLSGPALLSLSFSATKTSSSISISTSSSTTMATTAKIVYNLNSLNTSLNVFTTTTLMTSILMATTTDLFLQPVTINLKT